MPTSSTETPDAANGAAIPTGTNRVIGLSMGSGVAAATGAGLLWLMPGQSVVAEVAALGSAAAAASMLGAVEAYKIRRRAAELRENSTTRDEHFKEIFHDFESLRDKYYKLQIDRGVSELERGTLEIFIEYRRLGVRHLSELLGVIDRLYTLLYLADALSQPQESANELPGAALSVSYADLNPENVHSRASRLLKAHPEDRLKVECLVTGQSIRIRLRTGRKPYMRLNRDGDVEVFFPRGPATLFSAALLLGGAVHTGASTYKDAAEGYKAQVEAEKAMVETEKARAETEKILAESQKTQLEVEELRRKLGHSPEPLQMTLDADLRRFNRLTTEHADVTAIQVRSPG